MKPSVLLSCLIISVVLISRGDVPPGLTFVVTMEGIENTDILREGVSPQQLTHLTLETSQPGIAVNAFQILLARGKSPVGLAPLKFERNTVGLEAYRRFARSGDRLVIEILSLTGDAKIPSGSKVLMIPIK